MRVLFISTITDRLRPRFRIEQWKTEIGFDLDWNFPFLKCVVVNETYSS